MPTLRNAAVAIAWTVFIAGGYLGWIVLAVALRFSELEGVSSAAFFEWVRGAATPWVILLPPLAVAHGYRYGYLPGFRKPT